MGWKGMRIFNLHDGDKDKVVIAG